MDLVERVKGILLKPDAEWQAIAREPADMQSLFVNYVAILALIPAIAGFIGTSIVGISIPALGTVRVPVFTGLIGAIVGYVLTFVIVYAVALIIDALAPNFGGEKDMGSALKLSVYSYTPAWLAGIFVLIPGLRFLAILGLYGLYLLYVGISPLMRAPRERALLYSVAIVVCALIISIALGAIQGALFGI